MYTILFFAGARSKIEAAIFFYFDFLLVLLQYTYFHKLYIDLLTKNGIFIKKTFYLTFASKLTYILWLVSKRNGFIFYKYKLNSNKMVIISTHQTLFSTKTYINSFSFGNDELDAWIEHHRLFWKPLSIAIKLLTDTMSR